MLFSVQEKEGHFVFNVSYLKMITNHKYALTKDK